MGECKYLSSCCTPTRLKAVSLPHRCRSLRSTFIHGISKCDCRDLGSGPFASTCLSCVKPCALVQELIQAVFKLFFRYMCQLPNPHLSERSFSAVSTRILASKYAMFSIFRGLQDLHAFAAVRSKISRNVVDFLKKWLRNACQVTEILTVPQLVGRMVKIVVAQLPESSL